MVARPGNHLVYFHKTNRFLLVTSSKDKRLIACIRRVNIDAL